MCSISTGPPGISMSTPGSCPPLHLGTCSLAIPSSCIHFKSHLLSENLTFSVPPFNQTRCQGFFFRFRNIYWAVTMSQALCMCTTCYWDRLLIMCVPLDCKLQEAQTTYQSSCLLCLLSAEQIRCPLSCQINEFIRVYLYHVHLSDFTSLSVAWENNRYLFSYFGKNMNSISWCQTKGSLVYEMSVLTDAHGFCRVACSFSPYRPQSTHAHLTHCYSSNSPGF